MTLTKKVWQAWFLAILMVFSVSGAVMAAPKTTIGIIDTDRVAKGNPDMQWVLEKIRLDQAEAQKNFAANAKDLSREEQEKYAQKLQDQLDAKQNEYMSPIDKKINDAIIKVAESKGLSIVLNRKGVACGGVDITEEVINVMNGVKK